MSKKLLSEAQIRRFQSLASITPLQEMGSPMMDEEYQEGEYAEGHGAERMEDAHEDMEDAHAEGLYEEEDMEAEDQESDVELEEDLVDRFMEAAKTIEEMAQALGGAAGEMGDDKDLDLDVKMDDDAPEAPPMDDAPAPEGDEEEEKDILELALEGVNYQPSQKEIVSEVAKRVAKRIMEAKQAQARLNRALGNK